MPRPKNISYYLSFIVRISLAFIIHLYMYVHLPCIMICDLPRFQINQYKAFQYIE